MVAAARLPSGHANRCLSDLEASLLPPLYSSWAQCDQARCNIGMVIFALDLVGMSTIELYNGGRSRRLAWEHEPWSSFHETRALFSLFFHSCPAQQNWCMWHHTDGSLIAVVRALSDPEDHVESSGVCYLHVSVLLFVYVYLCKIYFARPMDLMPLFVWVYSENFWTTSFWDVQKPNVIQKSEARSILPWDFHLLPFLDIWL